MVFGSCSRQDNASAKKKKTHTKNDIIIPGTYEDVTLHSKRDFAGVN